MDITAANSSISLVIPPLFTTPQQLQGFATADVYEVPEVESVETLMGVDGVLSGGFVFKPIDQEFMLQADSASIDIFDIWYLQQVAGQTTYVASGVTTLPAISKSYTMVNGYLVGYKPLPQAKKLLQPQRFRIRWNLVAANPT